MTSAPTGTSASDDAPVASRIPVPDEVSAEHRNASRDLVTATRDLMLAASTTDVDVDNMHAAVEAMQHLTQSLGQRTRDRVVRAAFDGPQRSRAAGPEQPWQLFSHNPAGFPIAIAFDQDEASARVVANALYEGPRDSMHGGFSAHLMDCMLGTLMQARGQRALTATLDMRYLHRTPLDQPLDLFSRIVRVSGRKVIAEGWIEHEGRRTVEARGLFIDIDGNIGGGPDGNIGGDTGGDTA